jgi:hypothetical protein
MRQRRIPSRPIYIRRRRVVYSPVLLLPMTRTEKISKPVVLTAILSSIFLVPSSAVTADQDLRAVVSKMVENELNAQKNPRYWMYLDNKRERNHSQVDRVLQLPECWMTWPVSIDGRPPTAAERQHARGEIDKLVHDQDARRKNHRDIESDLQKANSVLKILPEAFLFIRDGRAGRSIKLKFRPDPKYDPSSNEAKVFHRMQGTLLIDAAEIRLARLNGYLISDVDFGLGILGKVYRGGTFEVVQSRLLPKVWEVSRLDVHISGRALLFHTIGEQQHETKTQFKRVPSGLTLAQAAALVEGGVQPGSAPVD